MSVFKERSLSGKEYASIFDYLYRLLWDGLYINIYKLLDGRKDVLSLPNFLIKFGQKAIWTTLKKNDIVIKIISTRCNKKAHSNLELGLNQNLDLTHYEQNKLNLSDIRSLLEIVQSKFEQVLSEKGFPVCHYALGKGKESTEYKKLLLKTFDI
ncbi:MAG: hypothetical protein K1000chlam4_00741 [Chlamydiae bacterium]|nr:hypothetical protein [Chlamydiota bacterium]